MERRSWTWQPRTAYLAAADDFDDLRGRIEEADTLPARAQDIYQKLFNTLEELARAENSVARRRAALNRAEREAWSHEEVENARAALSRAMDEAAEIREERDRLEDEYAAAADRLARYFIPVLTTEAGSPDLSPPKYREIRQRVGGPGS